MVETENHYRYSGFPVARPGDHLLFVSDGPIIRETKFFWLSGSNAGGSPKGGGTPHPKTRGKHKRGSRPRVTAAS